MSCKRLPPPPRKARAGGRTGLCFPGGAPEEDQSREPVVADLQSIGYRLQSLWMGNAAGFNGEPLPLPLIASPRAKPAI
jgi:hypothetical protein